MHGAVRSRFTKSHSGTGGRLWRGMLLVLIGLFSFFLAGDLHRHGIASRWGTAISGTLLTFGVVAYAFRSHFLRLSFWISFLLSLAVHCVMIGLIFRYALSGIDRFSPLFWLPFMLVETLI